MKPCIKMLQQETALFIGASLLLLMICGGRGQPAQKPATRLPASVSTCHLRSSDLGEFTGQGTNSNAALADALNQCQSRREAISALRPTAYLTSCADLSCPSDVTSL